MASDTPSVVRKTFAARLKMLRVPRGFRTARSLAERLGIDENRYTRYERAEVEPNLDILMRVCQTLSVTPNDLLLEASSGAPASAAGYGFHEPTRPFEPEPAPQTRPAAGTEDTRPETGAPPRGPTPSGRNAAIWRLAEVVQKLSAGEGRAKSGERSPWQETSRLFAVIERDPFAFVAGLADDPLLQRLGAEKQSELAEAVDGCMRAVARG